MYLQMVTFTSVQFVIYFLVVGEHKQSVSLSEYERPMYKYQVFY
jgi:hypothetical protein